MSDFAIIFSPRQAIDHAAGSTLPGGALLDCHLSSPYAPVLEVIELPASTVRRTAVSARSFRTAVRESGWRRVWSGTQGQKRTHLFTRPDGEWFWIAAIWETSVEFGSCYSMITTAANTFVASIHDRMHATLEAGEARAYLAGGKNAFTPAPESLRVDDAVNPLVKWKEPPVQGELF